MNENLIVDLEGRGVVSVTFRKLAAAKKEKIYRAILDAFGKDAFARVALESIARSAQVAKGSLVQYFSNKENLAVFGAETLFDGYQAHWERHFAVAQNGRARDRIIRFLFEEIRYWTENRAEALFYVKMMYENGAGFATSFREGFHELRLDYLHELLHSGIETREIRAGADIEVAAAMLAAFQSDFAGHIITGEKKISPEACEAIIRRSVEIVMVGLK